MTIEFLTAKQIQTERQISEPSFYRLIRLGMLPPGERVGIRGRRWRRDVVEAAFAALNAGEAA
jgi:predicted DNA-binding transcriptional regulator AlpA